MWRLTCCFALLAAVAASATAPQTGPDAVTEPRSGVLFPVHLTPPGGTAPHQLVGTAIRVKTWFRVKVYAFGLYVDPDGAQSTLSAFRTVPASSLERDERFFQRILDMEFAMTLRIVLTRDVGGKDVADSFDAALRPRIRRATADKDLSGGEAALRQFRGYFSFEEVAKGTEIVFSCSPGGRLETSVKGESRPAIQSAALCWALFDVYLGEKPISADGRKNLIAAFPGLFGSEAKQPPQLDNALSGLPPDSTFAPSARRSFSGRAPSAPSARAARRGRAPCRRVWAARSR
jgi:hypothetical protein